MAEIVLELDDIQSGVLRPRPAPYAATYVLFRIDDRDAGRELMRRLRSVVGFGGAVRALAQRYVGERRAELSGPESAGRTASVARELLAGVPAGDGGPRQGRWATTAKAVPSDGRSRSDRPMSTSWLPLWLPVRSSWKRRSKEPGKATGNSRESRRSGVRIVMCCRGRRKRSDSRTASVIPRSKDLESRVPILMRPTEGGRIRAGLPGRNERSAAGTATRHTGAQRKLRCVPQAAPARGRISPVFEGERHWRWKKRNCLRRK